MWIRRCWQGTHKMVWRQKFPENKKLKVKNWKRGKNYCTQPARSTGGRKRVRTVFCGVEVSCSEFRKFTRTGEILSALKNYILYLTERDRNPTFIYSNPIGIWSLLRCSLSPCFNAQISLILGKIRGRMLSDTWFAKVYSGITFEKDELIFIANHLTLGFIMLIALISSWESFQCLGPRWTGRSFSPRIGESEIFENFFIYSLRSTRKLVPFVVFLLWT